jgi:hypothetical protein
MRIPGQRLKNNRFRESDGNGIGTRICEDQGQPDKEKKIL